MKVAMRAIAVSVMLSLAWAGPLAPLAAAQQPVPPAPPAGVPPPPPPPPGTPPQMFQEDVKATPAERGGADIYDVGAVVATAAGFPVKAVICALGASLSGLVFAGTFGTRPDASAAMIHEACGGKSPWIVRGSDLRPRPTASKAFDWEEHRFDWER